MDYKSTLLNWGSQSQKINNLALGITLRTMVIIFKLFKLCMQQNAWQKVLHKMNV